MCVYSVRYVYVCIESKPVLFCVQMLCPLCIPSIYSLLHEDYAGLMIIIYM